MVWKYNVCLWFCVYISYTSNSLSYICILPLKLLYSCFYKHFSFWIPFPQCFNQWCNFRMLTYYHSNEPFPFILYLDGGTGNMVSCTHSLDWELCSSCSLDWFNRSPFIWCLEWWPEAGYPIWWRVWNFKEENKHHAICSYTWRPSEVAWRLLQGVFEVAISFHYSVNFRCVFCSPSHASC